MRRRYTAHEVCVIKRLFDNGASLQEVANLTNRSVRALVVWRAFNIQKKYPVIGRKAQRPRKWTKAEKEHLKLKLDEGKPLEVLSKEFERSKLSIIDMARKLGVVLESTWEEYEDDFLVAEYGKEVKILALKLDRTVTSVKARYAYLQQQGRIPNGKCNGS